MTASPSRRRTLRRGADFAAAGLATAERAAAIDLVAERYAVAVTPALAAAIADPQGALARQFVPDARELLAHPADRDDPIGDHAHSPVKGIVHRYPDRLLLLPLLTCPVYCRFCFRREQVGQAPALSDGELDAAVAYIAAHDEVWEVILSGGDPLMLPPPRLGALMRRLAAIPHVRTIRIHSRIPVVDPARISDGLVEALEVERAVWLAVHANHADELGPEARAACRHLSRAGIALVGQTVLLRGVNDDPAVLEALFRAMVECRIKPYYLHHPDLARGTAHFRLPIERGQEIVRALRGRLSGLAQPCYVLDVPGGHGKVPVGPVYYRDGEVEDWQGGRHRYPDPRR